MDVDHVPLHPLLLALLPLPLLLLLGLPHLLSRLFQPLALALPLLSDPRYGPGISSELVLGVTGGRVGRVVSLEGLFEDCAVHSVFLDVVIV